MNIYSSEQIYRKGSTAAGALGGFFTFGTDTVFGISNNHVIANLNACAVGDAVCRAGSQTQMGTLQYWIELDDTANFLDVALFKVDPGYYPSWTMPTGVIHPAPIREAVAGEAVYLVRNNGSVVTGSISNLYTGDAIPFLLGNKTFPFVNLVEVTPDNSAPFSVPGESGSVIFSSGHNVLGILLGTSVDTAKSYFIPFIHDNLGICSKYNLSVWRP